MSRPRLLALAVALIASATAGLFSWEPAAPRLDVPPVAEATAPVPPPAHDDAQPAAAEPGPSKSWRSYSLAVGNRWAPPRS